MKFISPEFLFYLKDEIVDDLFKIIFLNKYNFFNLENILNFDAKILIQ
jgi:hypothetical protein